MRQAGYIAKIRLVCQHPAPADQPSCSFGAGVSLRKPSSENLDKYSTLIQAHSPSYRQHSLLLVNPWIYDFAAFDLWIKPLGLLYLAAHLRASGYRLHLIDCLDRHHPELLRRQGRNTPQNRAYGIGKFFREICPKPPVLAHIPANYGCYGLPEDLFIAMLKAVPTPNAILVTSIMTYWYPGVFRAIALLREYFPGIPIILGGIYATLCPQHARTYSHADYVLTDREPRAIIAAVDALLNVPTRDSAPSQIFDQAPAYDLYPRLDSVGLLTSVGCPYRCSYCAAHILAPHFAQRPPDAVFRELLHLHETLGVRHVALYDDALLINAHDHIEPFMQQVLDANLDCTFHTPNGLHARYITEQMAHLMFRSGFRTIRLSLETVNPARQQTTGGKVRSEELAQAVTWLKDAGFTGQQIGVYVLIGLPGETLTETEETIRYVHNLGVQAHLCEYSPIPGTPDWSTLEQQGYVNADDDPLFHNNSLFIFQKQRVSFGQMQHLKDQIRTLNQRITAKA